MTDHHTSTPDAAAAYERDHGMPDDAPDVDEYADLMSDADRRAYAKRLPVDWWTQRPPSAVPDWWTR